MQYEPNLGTIGTHSGVEAPFKVVFSSSANEKNLHINDDGKNRENNNFISNFSAPMVKHYLYLLTVMRVK